MVTAGGRCLHSEATSHFPEEAAPKQTFTPKLICLRVMNHPEVKHLIIHEFTA